MRQNQPQTFNDGMVVIWKVGNTAVPGEKPVEKLEKKAALRFHQRTVGINRFWSALQNYVRISNVIRCQRVPNVTTQDIVTLTSGADGTRYAIRQIQYPEDIRPPVMDLTLEEMETCNGNVRQDKNSAAKRNV